MIIFAICIYVITTIYIEYRCQRNMLPEKENLLKRLNELRREERSI